MTEKRPASTWICTVETRPCTSKNPHRNVTCGWKLDAPPVHPLRALSAEWREQSTHQKMNATSRIYCRLLAECADELDAALNRLEQP